MPTPRTDIGTPAGAPRAALRTAFALAGTTSLTVQVLLLRELMVAWRGNELSFGLALAVWLTFTGAGSALVGPLAGRIGSPRLAFARGLLALSVLAPVALVVARLARDTVGVGAGELAGPGTLFLASIIALAPFTLVAGFLFAVGVAALSRERAPSAIGTVYILEAAGAAVGGILVSFVLLPHWDPVRIASFMAFLTAAAAFAIAHPPSAVPGTSPARVRAAAVAVALGSIVLLALSPAVDDATVGIAWKDLGFRSQTNSVYGRIVATQAGTQKSIYESGVLVASAPDRLAAEEAVHLPLLSHPGPSRVLLLGGGLAGTIDEILKHPTVTSVDFVELDPALVRTAASEFGDAMVGGHADGRVTVHYVDARFFVKRAHATYDVVIVNVPDPTTAQLNRFYTAGFFSEAERVLASGGLLGLAVSSAENYIGPDLARFLACVRTTLASAFEEVAIFPGDPCHFIAGPGATSARDVDLLIERVAERRLDVIHTRGYYLADRFSSERVAALDRAIEDVDSPLNTDLSPAGVYLSTVLWNRQFSRSPAFVRAAPRFLTLGNALIVAVVLAVALCAPALVRKAARSTLRRNVLVAVFVVGLTEISLEIAALIAFQSLYGYVYHRLALIVAAFMAGLAAGGWLGARAAARGAGPRAFALLELAIACVPLGLAATLTGLAGLPPDALAVWAGLFPLIVVGSAVLAGAQFPLAARLFATDAAVPSTAGGRLYGTDLAGSAVGAVFAGVILLPVMGIPGTMGALSLLNAAVLVGLVVPIVRLGRAA